MGEQGSRSSGRRADMDVMGMMDVIESRFTAPHLVGAGAREFDRGRVQLRSSARLLALASAEGPDRHGA